MRLQTSSPLLSRSILILGMHRSGTSALMGSFREAGLYLGDVLEEGFAHNPKGLQEPAALVHMHDNLLEANGGSWHAPPSEITWQPLHRSVRQLFIESRQHKPLWGFKEPRTLLVAQDWIDVLPQWTGVGIFRDPVEVAMSIQRRNGFDLDKGLRIWHAYNRRLLHLHQTYGVPVMEFVPDPQQMHHHITRLILHTGLIPPAEPQFFDPAIPQNSRADHTFALPKDVAETFGALREAAGA